MKHLHWGVDTVIVWENGNNSVQSDLYVSVSCQCQTLKLLNV